MGSFCFDRLGDIDLIMVLFVQMGVFCFTLKAPFYVKISTQTHTQYMYVEVDDFIC